MPDTACPVCREDNRQSFWFWEKEDKLMREWAMDTRVHFAICRSCGLIFQDPPAERAMDEFGFDAWGGPQQDPGFAEEPLVWLKQFSPIGERRGRALEVYHKEPRFTERLRAEGWETVRAVSVESLAEGTAGGGAEEPQPGEAFDVTFCFDALRHTGDPLGTLAKIHGLAAEGGGVYVEEANPAAAPRAGRLCLSSDEMCVFPFHTLIFALHAAGFMNAGAEMWSRTRVFGSKTDPNPGTDPETNIPRDVWQQAIHRFHRNYYWAWARRFLEEYLRKRHSDPDGALNQARAELRQNPANLLVIRDVCGACLLFANETDTLRETLSEDWPQTMSRVFETLKHDFALYDMYSLAPVEGLGVFPGIERYHFNEKMIYISGADYFEKYFSEEEARRLCEAIVKAGHAVCGHLSSFL